MDVFYNNQPFRATLVFKAGRTIDMTFTVYKWNPITQAWALYDLSGIRIDAQFRRLDGLLMKSISTITGEIIIVTSTYNFKTTGFLAEDFLEYDIKVTNGTDTFDLMDGYGVVHKHITP